MLQFDELVTTESTGETQCLLGKALLEAPTADVRPHALPALEPPLLALWVDSVSTRGHAPMPR
ncbi:hypothetical protein GCM10009811_24270 [Nostocoides veronense]|uniref:Uncharacterized protein n=1 Tax=Nostocoides veronense TaxID=330836 RepID=A0ABN2LX03_9MICO